MRFGIIGCGSIAASSFAPSLLNSRDTELAAVCRRDADGAREFARRFGGCAAYDSAAALIGDPAVEAVIVSTPTDTHCEHTLAAAAAGKHVLCEKPMARDRREARRMMEACRDAGVTLGIAYRRRLFPQVLEAKRGWRPARSAPRSSAAPTTAAAAASARGRGRPSPASAGR